MKSSQQEVISNHKAKDLYKIVLDIEKYPEFIPWCNSINIISKSKNEIFADMIVSHKYFVPQKFTSHVFFNSKVLKKIVMVNKIFKCLEEIICDFFS